MINHRVAGEAPEAGEIASTGGSEEGVNYYRKLQFESGSGDPRFLGRHGVEDR